MGSEANFRMVKRLMEQYDQKQAQTNKNAYNKHESD